MKPANILVTPAGVKLLDFGLALVDESDGAETASAATMLTAAGTIVGTVAYMSPEQARGQQVDGRSDIFSFGAVLYELLSGYPAFQGNSAIDTTAAIMRDEPPALDVPATSIGAVSLGGCG